jgi:S1-C subfamily serine protease
MNRNAYEAKVVKVLSGLGLAVLRITPKGNEKFHFLGLDDTSDLKTGAAIGKARGEFFVGLPKPANSSSIFSPLALPIVHIVSVNKNGETKLRLSQWPGSGGYPEVHGGALVNDQYKIVGILACNCDTLSWPCLEAIPVPVIRQCLHVAVPSILKSPTEIKLGIKAKVDTEVKLSKDVLKSINWPPDTDSDSFVSVEAVELDSAAEKASVLPGDILLKYGDDFITNITTFKNLEKHSIGMRSIVLTVLRKNKIIEIEVNII